MNLKRKFNVGLLLLVVATTQATLGQQVHQLPFGSVGNSIELTLTNNSSIPLSSVKVEAKNIPAWIHLLSREAVLHNIDPKGEAQALFSFSVDKSAPVNQKHTLLFSISSPSGEPRQTDGGQVWTKEISISVNPPDRFELLQNYPNPRLPLGFYYASGLTDD